MSRPLLVIFLTIFVNLVGFGIIIPVLPFYAETFGASPLVVGLLLASFSLSQLLATPALGVLSDRWGRRPVLIFSLLGTVVSFAIALRRALAGHDGRAGPAPAHGKPTGRGQACLRAALRRPDAWSLPLVTVSRPVRRMEP